MIPKFLAVTGLIFLCSAGLYAQNVFTEVYRYPVEIEWISSPTTHPEQALFPNLSIRTDGQPAGRFLIPWSKDNAVDSIVFTDQVWEKIDNEQAASWFQSLSLEEDLLFEVVQSREDVFLDISTLPYRKAKDGIERLKTMNITVYSTHVKKSEWEEIASKKQILYADNSVLSTGNWYKVSVSSNGIYSLTYNDLVNLGMNPATLDPRNIRVYGNGGRMLPEANAGLRYDDLVENAIRVVGEQDGKFDAGDLVVFYGQGPHQWNYNANSAAFEFVRHLYDDLNYYYITADAGPGLRLQDVTSSIAAPTHNVSAYQSYTVHEKEEYNLIKSGKQWFGEKFDIIKNYDLPTVVFQDIDLTKAVKVRASVVGKSTLVSSFRIVVDGVQVINPIVPPVPPSSYNNDYAKQVIESGSLFPLGPSLTTKVYYDPVAQGSVGWLDFIEYNAWRNLIFRGSQLPFRNASVTAQGNVAQFVVSSAPTNLSVWDVTDPLQPGNLILTHIQGNASFSLEMPYLREFIAFDGTAYLKPGLLGKIPNQNLHALPAAEMIIITDPNLIPQAQRLAQLHHDRENYNILLVTPREIYQEFSSGKQDISAIRDFIRMIYLRDDNQVKLKYVLLFGDGSFDPKARLQNNTNLIPAFQSWNSLQPVASYVTDDFYGLMDENEGDGASGILDIGIGRFPISSLSDAKAIVDKIERYTTIGAQGSTMFNPNEIPTLANWRNDLCFVADDQDQNLHLIQAEDLITYVQQNNKKYNIDKIYLDAYQQVSTPGGQRYPSVNTAINDRVGKGALIINYTGHGGETGLAHERVVEVADINSWTNKYNMPVFVTATCEFSRFDDPERVSAGELALINPKGGGIALFTTSRLSFSSSNFALNLNFYTKVFDKIGGEYPRMGDVIRLAKNPSNPNIRNFVLLGDPALPLAYPQYDVKTTHVNGQLVGQGPDTLKALATVTIGGYVCDENGDVISDFNGYIVPTVFDKPAEITTLGNDPDSSPRKFWLQKNIIFRGKASVVNGEFNFTFVVPKDIAYKMGTGRISYYATDEVTDASGYYEGIVIGGTSPDAPPDYEGPSISLFMNDTNFVMGGITDENPLMLAFVFDSSGVNTVGNGIGHDIVAILDGNTHLPIVLNDYYESALDDYQYGTIRYPFSRLAEGPHTLELKVWDVYNNSSTAYIEFVVAKSEGLTLNHMYNYPNPFKDQTWFVFEHNQPGRNLDVDIRIFSLDGRFVRQIRENVITAGFKTYPIPWDGSSEDGVPLAGGLYIYRVRVDGGEGYTNEMSGKMILIR